jgi:hypothetical protein
MRVTVEARRMNGNRWEYQVKDSAGGLVEDGRYFAEDKLTLA